MAYKFVKPESKSPAAASGKIRKKDLSADSLESLSSISTIQNAHAKSFGRISPAPSTGAIRKTKQYSSRESIKKSVKQRPFFLSPRDSRINVDDSAERSLHAIQAMFRDPALGTAVSVFSLFCRKKCFWDEKKGMKFTLIHISQGECQPMQSCRILPF